MIKKRNGAIDFWRFIFAVILVIYHAQTIEFALLHPDEEYFFPFALGSLSVEFFLLTSGFLFAKSMNKKNENDAFSWKDTWTFMKGKLMSFYPAYLICLVLTFIAVNATYYICRVEPYIDGATKADDVKNFGISIGRLLYEATLLRNFGVDFERYLDQAWYLSAMLLAMLLLYPIYAKNKRRFEYIIAPIIAVVLLGFLFLHGRSLLNPSKRFELFYKYEFTFKGNLRAMSEICLGVVCYRVCEWLKAVDFTKLGKWLLAALELFGYGFAIVYMHFLAGINNELFWHKLSMSLHASNPDIPIVDPMWNREFNAVQFVLLLFLAVSVTITFSEKSAISGLFNHKIFTVLGQYSLYPYLLYGVFSCTIPYWLKKFRIEMSTETVILWYCILTFVLAAIVMAAHTFVRNRLRRRKEAKG